MAVDFQVIFPQELVQLTRVRHTPASPLNLPRSLDIIGEDFRAVDEVLINGIESPDVMVVSDKRLIAQLPDNLQKGGTVNDVQVISRQLTVTPKSLIRFRIADQPGRVSGIMRVMQLFLKVLFTAPGTDIWQPGIGGNALGRIGATFGADSGSNVVADFVVAVDTAKKQILGMQGRDTRLPPQERLLAAKVVRATFNRELLALMVSVELTTQAGRAATMNLEL